MSEAQQPSHLSVTFSSAKHPCESDRGSALLQERIKLFAKIVFLIGCGFYVLVNLLAMFGPQHTLACCVTLPANWFHLASCLFLGGIWLYLSRKCLCRKTLRYVDAIGTIVLGMGYAGIFLAEGHFNANPYGLLLAVINTLVTRAIVVPSSATRTFWITTLAAAPGAATGSYLLLQGYEGGVADLPPTMPVVTVYLAWFVVAAVVATVASRVIYGLQREVQQARRLGQYTLEEKIGEGGMGEVFKASHAMLRRPTAVKLLRAERAGERSVARFEREVQLTSSLTHPNTIAIYDYGRTADGVFYYAMEFLDGLDLEELAKSFGPQPASRVIHILTQMCGSLAEAHEIGLIHRDIKPANVILCPRGGVSDVAKVVDFGLVKDVEHKYEVTVSAANTITGTPLYMSPESISDPENVNARSDLYAVGAVGYYILTGTHVFQSKKFLEITSHHLHTKPEPPSSRLGRPVPQDLEKLLLMCLEKKPDSRPKNARSLRAALEACQDAGNWRDEEATAWWTQYTEEKAAANRDSESSGDSAAAPTAASLASEASETAIVVAGRGAEPR